MTTLNFDDLVSPNATRGFRTLDWLALAAYCCEQAGSKGLAALVENVRTKLDAAGESQP